MVTLKKFVPVSVADNHRVYCRTIVMGKDGEFFDESFYLPFNLSLFGIHLPEYDWIVPGHTAPVESSHYYATDKNAHLKPENGTYRRVHIQMPHDFWKTGFYYEYNEDRTSYVRRKSEKRINSDRLKIMKDICAERIHYSEVTFNVVYEIDEVLILQDPVTKMEFPCNRRLCY